jgi:ornithine carbamoyltransferase
MNLKGRDFLKILDYSTEEILYLIDLALEFKNKKKNGILHKELNGKNVALIFEKDSTRTRCSFEVACSDLGMGSTYLGPTGSQIGKKETIEDTARVLSSIYDGIEYRGFGQDIVEELAKYSSVPVYNGLTNESHPTQVLADFLTIKEHFGYIKGLNFTYFGDARYNMGNSLMVICAKLGVNYTACCPKKYFPNEELVLKCARIANENNCKITLTEDVSVGVKDCNVMYTDVWVSMGEDDSLWKERINDLKPYQVNMDKIKQASSNVIFLHCLPSFHNADTKIGKDIFDKFGVGEMEVTDEVFESSYSKVFLEAENRMHTIKAVMYATLKDE